MSTAHPTNGAINRAARSDSGFSLIELMTAMTITLLVLASTMVAMTDALRSSETGSLVTGMNHGLRTAMDILVRDLLQVGQGLPSGRVISIPSGTGTTAIKLPGPPGTSFTIPTTQDTLSAVTPLAGLGPTLDGVATDVLVTLEGDSSFDQVRLTALTTTKMTVEAGVDITDGGPDDIRPGDLIMLTKGSSSTLVEITRLTGQSAFFEAGDSLNLNQVGVEAGNIEALLATAPSDVPSPTYLPTTATRIRMITYYIDATTDPSRPRLVRRMNNGNATTFDNALGTAVAFDLENFQISYDLVDGVTNPASVKMTVADLAGTGACSPDPCSPNQIRKVNVLLSGRSRAALQQTRQFFHNSLTTQVSLRSLAFVDRYQ